MKLFDNKKAQSKVEEQKQDSSETEKLKKQNRQLKHEVDCLASKINDLDARITDLRIEDDERWERVENSIRDHVDCCASKWIERYIDMAKIEDKVLLKVVKATFNNYQEEKSEE